MAVDPQSAAAKAGRSAMSNIMMAVVVLVGAGMVFSGTGFLIGRYTKEDVKICNYSGWRGQLFYTGMWVSAMPVGVMSTIIFAERVFQGWFWVAAGVTVFLVAVADLGRDFGIRERRMQLKASTRSRPRSSTIGVRSPTSARPCRR